MVAARDARGAIGQDALNDQSIEIGAQRRPSVARQRGPHPPGGGFVLSAFEVSGAPHGG